MEKMSIDFMSRLIDNENAGIGAELRAKTELVKNGGSAQSGISDLNGGAGSGSVTFSDMLRDAVDTVNTAQKEANFAVRELVAGRNKNVHQTMLAMEKADLSMKMMVKVRNKVLEAYREVMKMQV